MLDEEELGQLGALHTRVDGATEFALRSKFRMAARQGYVFEDCGQKSSKAMLRRAGPLPMNYRAGDMVCFRRKQTERGSGSAWAGPARIIGFEGKTV